MATVTKHKEVYQGVETWGYLVRYRDIENKRKQRRFPLKKQADEFKRKVEQEIECADRVTAKLTVAQVCEMYLRKEEERVRDKRIGRCYYRVTKAGIEHSILPYIGKRAFVELTISDVEDLFSRMRQGDEVSPDTARERIRVLGRIEAYALKRQLATKAVVADALKDLGGIKRETIRTFTAAEVHKLFSVVQHRRWAGHPRAADMVALWVHIAALCGLRMGEIRGLTVANVDLDRRLIKVRHNLTKHDELKAPKTKAGIRDVPMPSHVAEMLTRWLAVHHIANPRGLVFTTTSGAHVFPWNFWRGMWKPLLERAGLGGKPTFHFHALRHFAASWMIENGLPVTEVAILLGHSKFDMTLQVYAHPVIPVSRRHEAIERMATALMPAAIPAGKTTTLALTH